MGATLRLRRRSAGSRTGFTLIEVVISAVLTMIVVLIVGAAIDVTARQTRAEVARLETAAAARRILQQVERELGDAGGDLDAAVDYVTPSRAAGGANLTTLRFRQRRALTGVLATDWPEPEITYALVAAPGETFGNGTDDDADGVVDERALARTQGGTTVVLDEGVTRFLVNRAAGSDVVQVTLEIARGHERRRVTTNEGAAITHLTASVLMRNPAQ